ncbi:uncharacterized protein ervk-19 isoform X1 [Heterodontus francisci]|uniref:uncharacterized protein ervk-19 isoform X1 n=1 Tax=Heterodontus francisci TaxID=7792 RepID=UPI00355B2518
MTVRFQKSWWGRGFKKHAQQVADRCVVCQKNNPGPTTIMPQLRAPAPAGSFQCLQVDYITLPPCQGYTGILVIVDKFSRWVEAVPARNSTANHRAKVLCKDYIPRWGVPVSIDSDQGTHFTGAVCQEVSRLLNITWDLHCPHHPQSSGQMERMNQTLKQRLSKYHQEGLKWPQALPIVLCSIRATPNRTTGLSPSEAITGRPMSLPGTIDLRKADCHLMSDALLEYCKNLTNAISSASSQVSAAWGDPPEGGHDIIPGIWVYVKKIHNEPLGAKWEGPFQVLLTAQAAVKVEGKKAWIHTSHVKRATRD